MDPACIFDAIRTPVGRYGGACSSVASDDLDPISQPWRAIVRPARLLQVPTKQVICRGR